LVQQNRLQYYCLMNPLKQTKLIFRLAKMALDLPNKFSHASQNSTLPILQLR
jgi:hypothetical protein